MKRFVFSLVTLSFSSSLFLSSLYSYSLVGPPEELLKWFQC